MASVFLSFSTPALADSFDDQINALKSQAAAQSAEAARYHAEANNYRSRVNQLQAQINALRSQIQANQLQSTRLTGQIADAEAKLAHQKTVLGDIIKTMYFDSSVSPLEMLASSSNISDFLDQEQYRESIKGKIQDAMKEIQALQKSLEDQQAQLQRLIADQRSQQQQLAANQSEINQLLAVAAQNASAADAQVRSSNSQITKLKAEQAAVLAARFGGGGLTGGGACGGGYPGKWCNVPQDSVIDNWGMYNRECVSYAAFRVAVSGRYMPRWGGFGNANQWDENAHAYGIGVDGTPRVGDIAQTNAGPYGHVMYVEAILPGGKIRVSQYNFNNNGEYSEMTTSAAGLNFIHF